MGHFHGSADCPAEGKKCRTCKKEGHFAQWCRSKTQSRDFIGKRKEKRKYVKQVNDAPTDEFEGCNYVFTVSNTREDKDSRIDIEVGGVRISAIIDSGASVNIIDRHLWEYLKKNKIICTSHFT